MAKLSFRVTCPIAFRALVLLVLTSLVPSLASLGDTDVTRLAVFPFTSATASAEEPSAEGGLGTMLASRLATLFTQHCPDIRVVSQTVIDEVLRQQGMSDMGLIAESKIPEIGEIADADHFWTGTYRQTGLGVTVDAILWSVEDAAAARAVSVQLEWFFPSRVGHVEALACQVFQEMHRAMFVMPPSIDCPGASFFGEFTLVARAGAGSVRMSSLNNVIRQSIAQSGIWMDEIHMMPCVSAGIGYVAIPDMLTAYAEVEYLWARRGAGSSANVSLECSTVIPHVGLEWRFAPPWETSSRVFLRGAVGWASAKMEKRDVQGVLNCPASVFGNGIAYEASGGLSIPIGDALEIQLEGSYRGCRVSTTSIRLPTLDFTGATARLSIVWRFASVQE